MRGRGEGKIQSGPTRQVSMFIWYVMSWTARQCAGMQLSIVPEGG